MNPLATLRTMGVTVELADNGRLKIRGQEPNPAALEYAKQNKPAIIDALRSDLPNPSLPATCQLNHGGFAPAGCRFAHDLLMSLITAGVMPDRQVGCMFRDCCGELPDHREMKSSTIIKVGPPESAASLVPDDCEHCPACDKESMTCHHKAYFEHKAGRGVPCSQVRENCPRKESR